MDVMFIQVSNESYIWKFSLENALSNVTLFVINNKGKLHHFERAAQVLLF